MAEKLTELTPEQKELIPIVRDEWIAHGLSCEPADRAMAEEGVKLAYTVAELTPPKEMIWADSPLAGAKLAIEYQNMGEPKSAHSTNWSWQIAGNLWAGYYAWIDFYRRIGIEGLDLIEGQMIVAKASGWWWPLDEAVILTERPTGKIFSEQIAETGWNSHRLHNPNGPAIQWRDNWGVWAWHGTRVPQWVIEDPTTDKIIGESNTEIRRCAIENYGWANYLEDLNVSHLDECDDPGNPGQVLRLYSLPKEAQLYAEPVNMLVMKNASLDRGDRNRRIFAETVPTSCNTALAAAAWQFGVEESVYETIARAT